MQILSTLIAILVCVVDSLSWEISFHSRRKNKVNPLYTYSNCQSLVFKLLFLTLSFISRMIQLLKILNCWNECFVWDFWKLKYIVTLKYISINLINDLMVKAYQEGSWNYVDLWCNDPCMFIGAIDFTCRIIITYYMCFKCY